MEDAVGDILAEKGKWKSIKVLRETDELLEKYSKLLGMSKYEFVDFTTRMFGILLQERVKMHRDKVTTLGLIECEAEHDAEYSYLYPTCVVYNLVALYFRKMHAYQALLENLKQIYEYEKEKEAKVG